ncbi:butyrophilin subfamily 1 member A1-like isoform X2 [Simochromis diagramma]|uniref:butyrophilin subfamily 1 member A1-like isoform X2 n=1 Tax=Simochromis diagramma TaxID=43689 RepID=UPI001A7E7FEC|nr:butyrophilin subfamily 1 member A1-like isoform X2 [Simochromis diagramma]
MTHVKEWHPESSSAVPLSVSALVTMRGYTSLCEESSCTFPLWTLILCSAVVFKNVQGKSHLVCPSQVVAMMGDDVVLPCQLKLAVDANSETVEWTKPSVNPNIVHFHKDGRLVYENQNPSYHFRTRVFVDELIKGNVSLKIFKVKLSDEGTYRCFIPWIPEEASIVLTVASVSTPVIKVMSNVSSRVVLQCESAGWYPEPELLWLDGEGNLLSAGPTETLRGPDDLYTVSSRVTVEKRHSNNITCRVQQRNTNQSRETHIHVPDNRNDGRQQKKEENDIQSLMSIKLISTKGLLEKFEKKMQ